MSEPTQTPGDADDATELVETGRRGQRLVVEGWFASHGDGETPGPHVHLRTTDQHDPVLRTDQVPELITALSAVAGRIESSWASCGEQYATDVVLQAPDPQDPEVIKQQSLGRLRFNQGVLDNLPDVVRLVSEASSTDEAVTNIAALLHVDPADAMIELARFDLLTLTRPATKRRLRILADSER
jgi:hypothetical protein